MGVAAAVGGRLAALARPVLGACALAAIAAPARGEAAGAGALPRLSVALPADAADCPDAAAVADALREVMGRDVVTSDVSSASDERWFVEVRREPGGYGAVVRVEGARVGERRLNTPGASCGELRQAIAVTIALVLDHALVLEQAPAPKAPSLGEADGPARPWGVMLEGRVGAEAGLLRGVGAIVAAGAELRPPSGQWGWGAGVLWVTPTTVEHAPGEVRLTLWGGYLRGCRVVAGAPEGVHGSLCALGAVGALGGEGRGFPGGNEGGRQPWAAAGLAAALQGSLGRPLGWSLTATGYAPLLRGGFSVGRGGEAYEPSSVGASLDAGLWWSIW
jgi:hypothetical protein